MASVSRKTWPILLTKEFLYHQHYVLGNSGWKISAIVKCSYPTVYNYFKKHGIKCRNNELKKGNRNAAYKEFSPKRVAWNKGITGHPRRKGFRVPRPRGKDSPAWKGGHEPRHRHTADYKDWRKAVYERDDYTCQECGQRGGRLHAHHIAQWKDAPALRFDVSNGRTLCIPCHKKCHASRLKS